VAVASWNEDEGAAALVPVVERAVFVVDRCVGGDERHFVADERSKVEILRSYG
jgi:hypothetical protein